MKKMDKSYMISWGTTNPDDSDSDSAWKSDSLNISERARSGAAHLRAVTGNNYSGLRHGPGGSESNLNLIS